jgi:hypothetical protein
MESELVDTVINVKWETLSILPGPGPFFTLPCELPNAINDAIFTTLEKSPPVKDAINDFTRARIWGDSLLRRIMPPMPLEDELIPAVAQSGFPVTVGANKPVIKSVVRENISQSPSDIRQIMSDNALRDFMAEMDAAFIRDMNIVLDKPVDVKNEVVGQLTRDAVATGFALLEKQSLNTQPFQPQFNETTLKDLARWDSEQSRAPVIPVPPEKSKKPKKSRRTSFAWSRYGSSKL